MGITTRCCSSGMVGGIREQRLSELPLLRPGRAAPAHWPQWNGRSGGARCRARRPSTELFRAPSPSAAPDAVAVTGARGHHVELPARSLIGRQPSLADDLRRLGIGTESRSRWSASPTGALLGSSSPFSGSSEAGAAYVPLDPSATRTPSGSPSCCATQASAWCSRRILTPGSPGVDLPVRRSPLAFRDPPPEIGPTPSRRAAEERADGPFSRRVPESPRPTTWRTCMYTSGSTGRAEGNHVSPHRGIPRPSGVPLFLRGLRPRRRRRVRSPAGTRRLRPHGRPSRSWGPLAVNGARNRTPLRGRAAKWPPWRRPSPPTLVR